MKSGTRVIAGAVNADGTVRFGTGFVSRKLSTGTYQISFPPHVKVLGATASPIGQGGVRVDAAGFDSSNVGFSTWNTAWAFADQIFTFIVVVAA